MIFVTGPSICEPTGNLLLNLRPRIAERLLEAKRNAALLGLDGEDYGVDRVALLKNVAGVANLFAPGHFGDVDEAFDAGLDLDEGAEVHEARDRAGDALADLIAALARPPTARAEAA